MDAHAVGCIFIAVCAVPAVVENAVAVGNGSVDAYEVKVGAGNIRVSHSGIMGFKSTTGFGVVSLCIPPAGSCLVIEIKYLLWFVFMLPAPAG